VKLQLFGHLQSGVITFYFEGIERSESENRSTAMKDAYEVLYQKEADLARVRQEVESLRIAASLLTDEALAEQAGESPSRRSAMSAGESSLAAHLEAAATGTDGPSTTLHEPGFWKSLKGRRR
jgi:hypothetical protein